MLRAVNTASPDVAAQLTTLLNHQEVRHALKLEANGSSSHRGTRREGRVRAWRPALIGAVASVPGVGQTCSIASRDHAHDAYA